MRNERNTGYNIIFAKAGVLCFYESLVQGSSSFFQMNICAKNPAFANMRTVTGNPKKDRAKSTDI
jgi:hypothetical protein